MKKRILFLTGTRADFGKIKSLIRKTQASGNFEISIFITGMHMLSKYGSTHIEVEALGIGKTYKYINQNKHDTMDAVLAKTVLGLSDYIKEEPQDMIIVHGDRVEAMAGAIVGSLNNIIVSHIEGGEVSGTIDELIRHSVSKLSHLHFVANEEAKKRLLQLGESESSIFVIGSPDLDIMNSGNLPSMDAVREKYKIPYDEYGIVMFHPVTTDYQKMGIYTENLVTAMKNSGKNYVVIYPNNDAGTDLILMAYEGIKNHDNFRLFPSMRFEMFLTLMKNASFVLGNSSAGVREAPFYSIPAINIGNRQHNRVKLDSVLNCGYASAEIEDAIAKVPTVRCEKHTTFGTGNSDQLFLDQISQEATWNTAVQKHFQDIDAL